MSRRDDSLLVQDMLEHACLARHPAQITIPHLSDLEP